MIDTMPHDVSLIGTIDTGYGLAMIPGLLAGVVISPGVPALACSRKSAGHPPVLEAGDEAPLD